MSQPAYSTRSLYDAVVLKITGHDIINITSHAGKGLFHFRQAPSIAATLVLFHNKKLKLDAKDIFDTWRDLRTLAYAAVQSEANHE